MLNYLSSWWTTVPKETKTQYYGPARNYPMVKPDNHNFVIVTEQDIQSAINGLRHVETKVWVPEQRAGVLGELDRVFEMGIGNFFKAKARKSLDDRCFL